jgi:hypothetical protein
MLRHDRDYYTKGRFIVGAPLAREKNRPDPVRYGDKPKVSLDEIRERRKPNDRRGGRRRGAGFEYRISLARLNRPKLSISRACKTDRGAPSQIRGRIST